MERRRFLTASLAATAFAMTRRTFADIGRGPCPRSYDFRRTISREVLDNYLSRSITMEGLLNGRGDLNDNIRMLKRIGAKYIGRSICLWGGEGNLLANFERARQQMPQVRTISPETIFEACIFEIVTTEVEQVPVPDWAFTALGQPVEKRNFRYEAMLYPLPQRTRSWSKNAGVPDVSQTETQLWFYFLAKSYIDLGFEGIHWGQMEIMDKNDAHLDHYSHVFDLVRRYASRHARRGMVLCNAHVPSGGLVRNGELLLDFHAFPLRIKEVPDKPEEAILRWATWTASTCAARGDAPTAAGPATICRTWLSSIIGVSASIPGNRERQLDGKYLARSGSGDTTRSPGSPTRAARTARSGCVTPGTG